jgi:type 1 glutamine amidotransferase
VKRATPEALYNVWAHAYGIQALVRMHRRLPGDKERQKKIEDLIRLQMDYLARYESVDGGWGYYDFKIGSQRPAVDSTPFTTAAVLVALHEANQIGIKPPEKLIKSSVASIIRQRNPDFTYLYGEYLKWHPRSGINQPAGSLGRSQACNIALRYWGDSAVTNEIIKAWLNRLVTQNMWLDIGRKRPIPHEAKFQVAGYFYYFGHYYAGLCVEALPAADRPFYQDQLAQLLLPKQEKDGSWFDYPLYNYGHAYGTAFAVMTLLRCRHAPLEGNGAVDKPPSDQPDSNDEPLAGFSSGNSLPESQPYIVFVTGDCEYRSEISMPMLASILEKHHGMKCTVCYAVDETGAKKPKSLQRIQGLEALKNADLAVFFLRYRQLPAEQLQLIIDYVESGRPCVGFRTTTHAFRYPSGDEARWNDNFGRDVFGQKWISHHGHDSSTKVALAVADHPAVRGVAPEFFCRSWLYQVAPLVGDCQTLAIGQAVKGERPDGQLFGKANPVAWTKTYRSGRVFFTTLGHPRDFEHEAVRKLALNGVFWALGKEDAIPKSGVKADPVEPYIAPETTLAVPDPTLPYRGERLHVLGEEGNPVGR